MKPSLIAALSLFLLSFTTSNAAPSVTLHSGLLTLTGTTLTGTRLNRPIHRFLGIPYAEPPLGQLRFRKPVPWTPKEGTTLNALQWPDSCVQSADLAYQSDLSAEYKANSVNYSEDCLALNVWTPELNSEQLRPVIFWIHGGALLWDSASIEIYNGETLADRADAVVVTINYRLSTLGFLYADQVPDVPGNVGLWDQATALQWTQDHIRAFGGDPARVTIFGESAGAWSVSAHILSPVSRNLFANAIMASASITFKAAVTRERQVANLLKGIRAVGCATEADQAIDSRIVECLEKMDATKVETIAYMLTNNSKDIAPQITIDGEFLPDTPHRMLASGNHKKNFNLLLDTVEDEGSFFLYFFGQPDPRFARLNPAPITLAEAKQYLLDLLAKNILYRTDLPNDTITRTYFSGLNANFDEPNLFRKQVGIAFGDLMLNCPAIDFAKKIFASAPENVNVYQWFYSAKQGNVQKWACSKWGGTCHGDDLNPMFGAPFRHPEQYTNRERDISAEIIDIISNFIRDGTPGPYQTEWIPYYIEKSKDDGNAQVIAPYYEIGNAPKTYRSFGTNLKHFECETIWDRFLSDPRSYS